MIISLKYYKGEASVRFGRYGNGRTAISLVSPAGEPLATATVNLPDAHLEPNEVFIKSWSENEGMHQALTEVGLIGPQLRTVPTGHVIATKHKLLVSPSISAELRLFLQDWFAWAFNGGRQNRPYRNWCGLCHNAQIFEKNRGLERGVLYDELTEILEPRAYPFGAADYDFHREAGTQHLCPKRLAWVKLQLEVSS